MFFSELYTVTHFCFIESHNFEQQQWNINQEAMKMLDDVERPTIGNSVGENVEKGIDLRQDKGMNLFEIVHISHC